MVFSWKVDLLIAILAAAGILYLYKGRGLTPVENELLRLRISFLVLLSVFLVGFITEPSFAYYIDTEPAHIQSIEDAKTAIQRTNETVERLVKDMREYTQMATITFALLIVWVLPSFLRISEHVLVGEDNELEEKEEKLISIFDNDKQ